MNYIGYTDEDWVKIRETMNPDWLKNFEVLNTDWENSILELAAIINAKRARGKEILAQTPRVIIWRDNSLSTSR